CAEHCGAVDADLASQTSRRRRAALGRSGAGMHRRPSSLLPRFVAQSVSPPFPRLNTDGKPGTCARQTAMPLPGFGHLPDFRQHPPPSSYIPADKWLFLSPFDLAGTLPLLVSVTEQPTGSAAAHFRE